MTQQVTGKLSFAEIAGTVTAFCVNFAKRKPRKREACGVKGLHLAVRRKEYQCSFILRRISEGVKESAEYHKNNKEIDFYLLCRI